MSYIWKKSNKKKKKNDVLIVYINIVQFKKKKNLGGPLVTSYLKKLFFIKEKIYKR